MEKVITVMYWSIRITVFFVVIALMFGACSYFNRQLNQKDDWWGEELLEDVIEDRIGFSVDLTPNSKE